MLSFGDRVKRTLQSPTAAEKRQKLVITSLKEVMESQVPKENEQISVNLDRLLPNDMAQTYALCMQKVRRYGILAFFVHDLYIQGTYIHA